MATVISITPTRVIFGASGSGKAIDSDKDYMRVAPSGGTAFPFTATWFFADAGTGFAARSAWRWSVGSTAKAWDNTTYTPSAPSGDPSAYYIDFLG